jgi:hypothetical protein
MRREILPGISHGGCYTGFTKPATEPMRREQRNYIVNTEIMIVNTPPLPGVCWRL